MSASGSRLTKGTGFIYVFRANLSETFKKIFPTPYWSKQKQATTLQCVFASKTLGGRTYDSPLGQDSDSPTFEQNFHRRYLSFIGAPLSWVYKLFFRRETSSFLSYPFPSKFQNGRKPL